MPIDATGKGLGTLIMPHLADINGLSETPEGVSGGHTQAGSSGGFIESPASYDQEYAGNTDQLIDRNFIGLTFGARSASHPPSFTTAG